MNLNLLILSNLAYLLAFVLAVEKGYLLYSIPYLVLFITSNIYHLNNESEKYRIYDQISAFGVIAMNSYMIYLLYKKNKFLTSISVILALASFFIYFNYGKIEKTEYNYEEWHSLWHILSGIGSAVLYC